MQLINRDIRFTVQILMTIIVFVLAPSLTFANSRDNGPDCTSPDGYAVSVAFVYLKNAGITNNYKLDFTKTKVTRLASEKIGKDLYRQVHYILFTEKSGTEIAVITVNDASFKECSMSGVEVFVVTKHFGELGELN